MLPKPCIECQRGDFVLIGKGMARCTCERAMALRYMDEERRHQVERNINPLISEETAALGVSMLSIIPWFPTEGPARFVVAGELQSMCRSEEEMDWLVRRMTRLFERWPGIPAMRAVFCSRFNPLDRLQSTAVIEAYPEGIPSEFPEVMAPHLALPPGAIASADSHLDSGVRLVAQALDMNRVPARLPRPVPSPISANYQPITQADIEKAVQELHEKRARGELLPPESVA
jgi:hypothetical protein